MSLVTAPPALILTRRDIAALMSPDDYLAAVESGFRSLADGHAEVPMPMHLHADGGSFHGKGARVVLDRAYVAIKLNSNFPANAQTHGLPTIQGVVVLCDGADGTVLAVMDSIGLTAGRTAAASALAAKFLAPKNPECIAICGCGEQGRAHLMALTRVLALARALVWDVDFDRARTFAHDMREALRLDVVAVREAAQATRASGVIVTATTARAPFVTRDMIALGAFIAAVGADSADKSELAPELMANATIVVDLVAQAATMGDLHHAIDAGVVSLTDVHAELAELITGRKPGRTRADEIIVFDSTGTAIQDVASAAFVFRRAVEANIGRPIVFGAP